MTVLAPLQVLRLTHAAGTRITLLGGRVWITESGRTDDVFLSAGESHRVEGDGVVVIEAMALRQAPAEPARLMVWPASPADDRRPRATRPGLA